MTTVSTTRSPVTDPMVDNTPAQSLIEASGIANAGDFGNTIRKIDTAKSEASKAIDKLFSDLTARCLRANANGSIVSTPLSTEESDAMVNPVAEIVGAFLTEAANASAAISRIGHGDNPNVNVTTIDGVQINRVSALIGLHGFKSAAKTFKDQVKVFLKGSKLK